MATRIGPLAARRSIWIDATPERVWEEFATLERMRRWFGTGHKLVRYEPRVGADVETDAGQLDADDLRFVGRVLVFDPPRELAALSDGTQRAILDQLRENNQLATGEIADRFPRISRPAVSKHLGVLREAGWCVGGTWSREPLHARRSSAC